MFLSGVWMEEEDREGEADTVMLVLLAARLLLLAGEWEKSKLLPGRERDKAKMFS